MTGIDQMTRDYAVTANGREWEAGATFADHAHRTYGACLEVSGDMIASIRVSLAATNAGGESDGPDCGA